MKTTTVQLSQKTYDEISTFGTENETVDTIIKRIYDIAVKERLRQFLMSSEGCIPIEEAIKRHKEKWSE